MFTRFKYRSKEEEIIDDLSYDGPDLNATFKTIERINTFLGGNWVLVQGVKEIINSFESYNGEPIRMLDLGTGSGDGLRAVAKWSQSNGVNLIIKGIDANPHIIKIAEQSTPSTFGITYGVENIFDPEFSYADSDIVTCNLFLHHFSKEQIIGMLNKMKEQKVKAILINDLHRHWFAYYAFALICRLTGATPTARKDGLLSIRKGFLKHELLRLAQMVPRTKVEIKWKWAFRYQCIIII